jgi:hypothetical protein
MAIYRKVHFKPEQHAYLMTLLEADTARLGLGSPGFDLAYQTYIKLRDCTVIDSWGPTSKRKPKD